MTKKTKKVAAPAISKVSGFYTGSELRPYVGRPGAMDAYNLPSRVGDTYKEHKPPIGMASSTVPVGWQR